MKFGLEREYEIFVEIDADSSHQAAELPELLKISEPNAIVIASRYVKGSKIVNWPLKRRAFSFLANLYAGFILRLGIHDYTNGYRIYGREALKKLEFEKIKATGYVVLSEVAYQLFRKGVKLIEQKSLFINRRRGQSNFSLAEIKESFLSVLRIKRES